ncbi:SDR family NAD(P)-dependent oxidoreductase [Nocardia asiatica]|uniref:SDR family NAD(P)-dependent oxidoreductase n=1 Tax=Nocardia asiatica TaxID=209252 RepID=UPI003EE0C87E
MSHPGTALIVGVGPGLGMSMARRFGRAGFRVALISRSAERHAAYLADLAGQGVDATAHVADVTDRSRLAAVLGDIRGQGPIGMVYYGPGPTQQPVPITDIIPLRRKPRSSGSGPRSTW